MERVEGKSLSLQNCVMKNLKEKKRNVVSNCKNICQGYSTQWIRLPVGSPIYHIRLLLQVQATPFPIQLLCNAHPGKKKKRWWQILGSLSLTWENHGEYLAIGYGLAPPWLSWTFWESTIWCKNFIHLLLCPSLLLFQIEMNIQKDFC